MHMLLRPLCVAACLLSTIAVLDARAEAPLPLNLKIVESAAGVPADVAAFLGVWRGQWEGVLDTALAVTEIRPDKSGGYAASVFYGWGVYQPWFITGSGYREYDARIKDGVLTIERGRLNVQYQLAVDRKSLEGTWDAARGQYRGALTKVGER